MLIRQHYDRQPLDAPPEDHAQPPRSHDAPWQESAHMMACLGTHMSHSQIDSVRSHHTSWTQQLITYTSYLLIHILSQTPVLVNQPHYIYRSPTYISVPQQHGYLMLAL